MTLKTTIYIFADLDDSLFQTARKCPSTTLSTAALDRHGQPLSYFTPEQKSLVELLELATLIPVTGRTLAALERVKLTFSSYRIVSHGALIVGADGKPDAEWMATLRPAYAAWRCPLEEAAAWVNAAIIRDKLTLRCRVIEDQGLPVYVSIKGDAQALSSMAAVIPEIWCGTGTRVHHNGHNMALLPPFASKEQAVRFLMQRLRLDSTSPLFIGLGDSHTDLPFLRLCHYALTPRDSQIQRGWP